MDGETTGKIGKVTCPSDGRIYSDVSFCANPEAHAAAIEAAGQHTATSIVTLREQNAVLVALLVQCALAANTLRTDFEKYATHSGFNDEFVNAVCAAAGVPRNHGYGNAEYQSQHAALASAKGGA